MYKNTFRLLFLSFMLIACSVKPTLESPSRQMQLLELLKSLDPNVDSKEAEKLTKDLFQKTAALTKEFELTSPPLLHNALVNIGLRKKGLCYHWSDALYNHFLKQRYPSFEFHMIAANISEYFSEHNALVIIKKGGSIDEGIVIDPWRNSGKLYFCKIKDDKKYKWIHRTDRGCIH